MRIEIVDVKVQETHVNHTADAGEGVTLMLNQC